MFKKLKTEDEEFEQLLETIKSVIEDHEVDVLIKNGGTPPHKAP